MAKNIDNKTENGVLREVALPFCLDSIYIGNSKIDLRLVGQKKHVIAPKRTLSSNK
jgi:hypothetical protein